MIDIFLLSWFLGVPNFLVGILYGFGFGFVICKYFRPTRLAMLFPIFVFGSLTYLMPNQILITFQMTFAEAFQQFSTSQEAQNVISGLLLGFGSIIGYIASLLVWHFKQDKPHPA